MVIACSSETRRAEQQQLLVLHLCKHTKPVPTRPLWMAFRVGGEAELERARHGPKARHSSDRLRAFWSVSGRSFRPCEGHDAYEANDPGDSDKDHERYFHCSLLRSLALVEEGCRRGAWVGTPRLPSSSASTRIGAPGARRKCGDEALAS